MPALELLTSDSINAYTKAKTRWEQMIVGNLPSVSTSSAPVADWCTASSFPSEIDDVHICGRDEEIDGVGR